MKKHWLLVVALLAAALLVAACGDDEEEPASGGGGAASEEASGGEGGKIAFLLPESKTARYETQDRPLFEAKVKQLCSSCEVVYSNADQDAAKQKQQAEAALAQGVKVMVLDPVDGAAAASIVDQANAKQVPVVSYDRLLLNSKPDYYVEFDSPSVGRIQGEALVEKLKADGHESGAIVMINGAPTDNNAKLFKQGAHAVIDESGFEVAKEYDTPDWSPDKAQQEMEQAITSVGKDGFIGVYAANDGTAGGAIAAMKSAGVDPAKVPVTGQDAELAAIQRILAGEQYMTVYKPIKPLAEKAAEWAVMLVRGQKPKDATATEDNGEIKVPTIKLEVVPVTKDEVKETVIADGFWKAEDVCTGQYKAACDEAGIS